MDVNDENVFRENFSNEEYNPTNADLLHELQRQTRLLDTINTSIDKIANSGQGFRYQYYDDIYNTYNSNRSTARTRTSASSSRNRSRGRDSFESDTKKDLDDIKETLHKLSKGLGDAVDEFEKGVRKSLISEPEISKILNQHIRNLADSLGIEMDELPKVFGKRLANMFKDYVNVAGANGNVFASGIGKMLDEYNYMQGAINEKISNFTRNTINKIFPGVDTGEYEDVRDTVFEREAQEEAKEERKRARRRAGFEEEEPPYNEFEDMFGGFGFGFENAFQEIYVDKLLATVSQAIFTVEGFSQEQEEEPEWNNDFYKGREDFTSYEEMGESYENSRIGSNLPSVISEEGTTAEEMQGIKQLPQVIEQLPGEIGESVGGAAGGIADAVGGVFGGEGVAAIAGAAGTAVMGAATAGIGLAMMAIVKSVQADFKELMGELKQMAEVLQKTRKRYDNESKEVVENGTKRMLDDIETIVKEPFQILEDAANKVYEVWDNELQIINATQGYTKSDLQDLMSNYAYRLEEEGLTSVVSAADMTENLAKVLEAGLSGAAAEEFAYIATILDAAIPTQEFFDYADTYVALAGNMIAQGYSESAALEYANEQLEIFASNTLYASRQLTGGFTTGLKNASDIFAQSVKIVQTAGYGDVGEISSVLTAVAAVTGSIAPDLATDMTDLIVQAATGGNSSELVALRSLAGINASNTEFLNQLINDPQSVFVTMFTNLDKLINTSNDAYMEVAESLSNIFGISMDALRRIDFNYLADAIANMDVSNSSLEENLALLASGETTTNKEQLRMQQINQYLLEEGLAYVVDNEAARFIQQHMWEEQIADELMDATYGVELVGDTFSLLNSILSTVANIFTLGLRKLVSTISNAVQNVRETNAWEKDVKEVLEAGKVGQGNAQDLYNLTTVRKNLNLTDDLVTLLTGTQGAYSQISRWNNPSWASRALGTGFGRNTKAKDVSSASDASAVSGYRSISSMYTWSTAVGKSAVNSAGMLSGGTPTGSQVSQLSTSSSTDASLNKLQKSFDQMLSEDYMREILEEGGTYEDWYNSARKFGISDLSEVMDELGYQESEVKSQFESVQAAMSNEESNRFYEREEEFWGNVEDWLEQIYTFMDEQIYQDALIAQIHDEALMDKIYQDALMDNIYQDALEDDIYKYLTKFYDEWYTYNVLHKQYSAAYDHKNVTAVQNKEKSGSQDAIYALAEELTKNTVDLLDPTMQTNALLAEILIVVNAIMQNENAETSATSLTDTLSGLALGLFNTSTT